MQEFYLHGVPKNTSDMKAADTDTLQQQQQHETNNNQTNAADPMSMYKNKYQRLVIVLRRGKYQEYTMDSGRSVSHQELKEAALENLNKRCYTFGAIPNELIEKTIYTRQQLFDMGAHR
jgi:mannitol-specific phosphotransferase system IIBC component